MDGSSNSTLQIYSVVQNEAIILTEGSPLDYVVFEQKGVVNPILDKFTTPTGNSVNRALYLHTNEMNEIEQGLPLYVYIHGMGRGGTNVTIDQKAAMKSANGAVALMKKMEENPDKYASHVLNISYSGMSTPSTANVKAVIDNLVTSGAVDPYRIYVAGFSWGGQYTNTLINAYPGFFAAGAPMSPVGGSPNAASNEAHKNFAYWMFVNAYDGGSYQNNLNNFINNNLPKMTNARATLLDSNKSLVWPYNQFDQPEQNPPLQTFVAHEVEAAVLYNNVYETDWNMAPTAGTLDARYKDVFDWMFAQFRSDNRIDELMEMVTGLDIVRGNKVALTANLSNAARLMNHHNTQPSISNLEEFISKVEYFVSIGRISEEAATVMIDAAEETIRYINYMNKLR